MARATVTKELAETLRSIRLQNKIQAKKLAEHIGKSPAYISKLENCGIQSIDTGELNTILKFISGEDRIPELAEKIYKTLNIKYTPKEIEQQVWFTNYDTVQCLLPIPEGLRNDLNCRIKGLNISRKYLLSRINANEALEDDIIKDNTIPVNQWFSSEDMGPTAQSIKIEISKSQLDEILDNPDHVEAYVFVFSVLFYLLKIHEFNDTISISDEQNAALMKSTTEILNSYTFLSIAQKNIILADKKSEEDIQSLISSFDTDNLNLMREIIDGFQVATQHNIKSANEQLKGFCDNMHWDLGFMLKLVSFNFSSLQNTSFSNKKNLLYEIEDLIKKYKEIPEEKNVIEEY